MDMNVRPEDLDTVCEGCLSTDRHLTAEVTDLQIKKLYYEILNIAVEVSTTKKKELKKMIFFFTSFYLIVVI